MKILFLTKRFTTGKDFLRERYGRMYELSRALSEQGHDVTGVYFSYQYGMVAPDTSAEPVNWIGYAVDYTRVAGWLRYLQGLDALVKVKRPDIIIGASDSPHVIVAAWLAKRHDLPYIVDLYDNFESFGLTRLPLIRGLFRKALRQADGISVVTDELGGHVQSVCRPKSLPKTVENAVPEGVFTVINSRDARESLGLPMTGVLVGTAGALDASRGIDTLYKGFLSLAVQRDDLHLVIAGRPDRHHPVPEHDRIHYLGNLDYECIPRLFNALDIGVICNRPGAFGNYCFPQKLYEMLACRLPVVAADVGVMHRLFWDYQDNLYSPGDADSLSHALATQAQGPLLPDLAVPVWADQGRRLHELLQQVVNDRG